MHDIWDNFGPQLDEMRLYTFFITKIFKTFTENLDSNKLKKLELVLIHDDQLVEVCKKFPLLVKLHVYNFTIIRDWNPVQSLKYLQYFSIGQESEFYI